jgi:hypothetical protein
VSSGGENVCDASAHSLAGAWNSDKQHGKYFCG